MLWPKKNSYKEFDNEKKFLRLENSPPPMTILMVCPLTWWTSQWKAPLVVYHLQKNSWKPGWKGSGTWLFGSFHLRISESNGMSGKVFQTCSLGRNVPSGNLCSISSKLSLIPISGLRVCFSVNGTDLCKLWTRFRGQNLHWVMNFAYHLPNREPTCFPM